MLRFKGLLPPNSCQFCSHHTGGALAPTHMRVLPIRAASRASRTLRRKSTLVSSYTPRVSRRVEGWGWWGLFAVTNSEQGCVGNSHVSVSSQNQVELLECEPSNPAMTGGSVPIATMRPQFLPRPCSGHAGSAGTLMLPWMICFGFPGRSTSSS